MLAKAWTALRDSWNTRYAFEDTRALDHLYTTLEATRDKHPPDPQARPEIVAAAAVLEDLLKKKRSWSDSHRMKLLAICLLSDEEIEVEIKRSLLEVSRHLPQDADAFYNKTLTEDAGRPEKEALLSQIIDDLDRYHILQRERNFYTIVTRIRMGLIFIVSFLFFFIPLFLLQEPELTDDWSAFSRIFVGNNRANNILIALASGWLGASFSMSLHLSQNLADGTLRDLKIMSRFTSLLFRGILGMGASLIFYYFVQSGILSGNLLPTFDSDHAGVLAGHPKNLALLVIGCFLSGFSEKLIPGILAQTERQIEGKASA